MLEVVDLDEKRKKEERSEGRTKDEKIAAMYDAFGEMADTINNLIDILNDLKGDLTEVLNE